MVPQPFVAVDRCVTVDLIARDGGRARERDTVTVLDTVDEYATLSRPRTQPAVALADTVGMLHFQKLDVYQRAIEFLTLANRIRARL